MNAVANKLDGNMRSRKGKKCFSCDQEGHFIEDKKCPAHDQACRMCGVVGHFRVKCSQACQHGSGGSRFRGGKGGKGADGGRRNTWSRQGDDRGRCGRGHGRWQETNLMADGNHSKEPTILVQHSLEFAFTVERLTGYEQKRSDLITLIVGDVAVSDVLIDSGTTCNMVGQQTWEMLKLKGISCESRKSARELFAYGGTEPLPTLGAFTADVLLTGNNCGCRADFMVFKGDGRMLLGCETAEILNLKCTLVPSKQTMLTVEDLRVVSGRNARPC